MDSTIRLAIADANTLLREGLKRLLHDVKDFLVIGEAANDVETVDLVEQLRPDVLLLDRDLPKVEAVPIQLAIKEQNLPTKVLILSLFPDQSKILNSARAGARGYILKSTPFAVLAEAIREVSRGRIWVDSHTGFADIFALLADRASTSNEIEGEISLLDLLSRKELAILNLIARGMTNEDIGKKLLVSPKTVKTHASNIFDKLKVKNRTEAALLLMQARSRYGQGDPGRLLRTA